MSDPIRPVSILIPYHNRADLTAPCLASLARFTEASQAEIILVDDASNEPFDPAPLLAGFSWKIIRNEARRSYSENNNAAAALAGGEFLVLLNNDTLVHAGWLDALIAVARATDRLGVLGNKHLFPDSGKLHHCGMAFTRDGRPLHLHPGTDPEAPSVNVQREVPCVTFACVLIPSAVYRELSGLDEGYRNGCEDVDFCLRARAAGYRVVYTPASVIEHYGQATPGRTVGEDANFQRLAARWPDVERTVEKIEDADRAHNGRCPAINFRPRARSGGMHFAVDMSVPSAFVWATVEMVQALTRQGTAVSLPPGPIHRSIPRSTARELIRLQSARPFTDVHLKWSHYWFLKQPLAGDVNAEFFCTNYRFRSEGRFLDQWMRHVQLNEFRKLPIAGFNLDALLEVGVPASDCQVVPLGYAPEIERLYPQGKPAGLSGQPLKILLVTNSHDLNRYGTDLAVAALARAFGPESPVEVHIKDYAGLAASGVDALIARQPRFPKVIWHKTFLDKEDLIHLYAGMDVQLAPFRGEGFAMKIMDAMALGLPTLMPLFGGPLEFATAETCWPLPFAEVPVGSCFDRESYYMGAGAWWCEPDLDALTEALTQLPESRPRLAALGQSGRQSVVGRFTWQAAAQRLTGALGAWQACRQVAVSRRAAPDLRDISIIIPTKNRPDNLGLTLAGYRAQTLARDRYELVLVNDHGDAEQLAQVTSAFPELPLRVLENRGPGGPGAARNAGLEVARGSVVLITGDDIVPEPTLLEQHLQAHQRWPNAEEAMVGLTCWHKDLPKDAFHDYLTGAGGQQFKYDDMQPGARVPFDRFYTSNVSVKRRFLIGEERLFSDKYRFAAYEDVELGYRLHLRGLVLRFLPEALGAHRHPMTPTSFAERQRKVGRMLAVLAMQRPDYMPNSHLAWLRALEFLRVQPGLMQGLSDPVHVSDDMVTDGVAVFCAMLESTARLTKEGASMLAAQDGQTYRTWMLKGCGQTWDSLNAMILRLGMAEEWAGNHPVYVEPAKAWVMTILYRNLLVGDARPWDVPFAAPDATPRLLARYPRLARWGNQVMQMPGVADSAHRFAQTGLGRWIKNRIES